jgi:hypothetical protein
MTKMDYSRGYTHLTRPNELPAATPISRAQRAAYWAKKSNLKKKHEQANMPAEIRHADHPASVRSGYGRYVVWCDQCRCEITELTRQQYEVWRELNPPKVKKST